MRRIARCGSLGRPPPSAFAVRSAYAYLTLPDVRPLRTTQSRDDRVHGAARAGGARAAASRAGATSAGCLQPHLPDLKRAVLVAEDDAFWQHEGVDFEQLQEVDRGRTSSAMEFARGGSTITQQLAKNLYLSPSKNPLRKLRELHHRAPARSGAEEDAHPRAVPERDRVGRRHLRRRGRRAHVFPHVGGRARRRRRRRCSPRAIVNPRVLDPAHPTARLLRRQQMILRRMGAVTPPPVAPVAAEPDAVSPRARSGASSRAPLTIPGTSCRSERRRRSPAALAGTRNRG